LPPVPAVVVLAPGPAAALLAGRRPPVAPAAGFAPSPLRAGDGFAAARGCVALAGFVGFAISSLGCDLEIAVACGQALPRRIRAAGGRATRLQKLSYPLVLPDDRKIETGVMDTRGPRLRIKLHDHGAPTADRK
jgi:hypothetical protein